MPLLIEGDCNDIRATGEAGVEYQAAALAHNQHSHHVKVREDGISCPFRQMHSDNPAMLAARRRADHRPCVEGISVTRIE